jgi:hypothetical protein
VYLLVFPPCANAFDESQWELMPNTLYYGDNLQVLREHIPAARGGEWSSVQVMRVLASA